jgi:hypothetical protein
MPYTWRLWREVEFVTKVSIPYNWQAGPTFRSMTKPSEMAISTIFGEQAVTADRFTDRGKESNRCSLASVHIGQI